MIKILISISLFLLPVSSINVSDNVACSSKDSDYSVEHEFLAWSQELLAEINEDELEIQVFRLALKGYLKLDDENKIEKPGIISIIDFSKSSNKERLFIVDIESKKLLFKELVAHGIKTGVEFAKYFSNTRYSNQSSLGFYVTGRTYSGKNGFSLKLHGKENAFNSKAFERGIVVHGASYVSDKFIKKNGRLGRSFGCPAVPSDKNNTIINTIKNGTCFFIYYPDEKYLSHSYLID